MTINKKIIISITILFLVSLAHAQESFEWNWAIQSGSIDGSTTLRQNYVDSKGNTYVIGDFGGRTLNFNGATVQNMNYSKVNFFSRAFFSTDVFVAKVASNGNLLWLQTIRGKKGETGLSVIANERGDVWLMGSSNSDTIFVGETSVKLKETSSRNSPAFLIKLNSNGDLDWTKKLTTESTLNDAYIRFNGNYLSILCSAREEQIEILEHNVSASFNSLSPTYVLLKLSASDGTFSSLQTIGQKNTDKERVSHEYHQVKYFKNHFYIMGRIQENSIRYGDKTINFSQPNNNRYVVKIDLEGNALALFEHNAYTYGNKNMAINDSLIVIATTERQLANNGNHISLSYYDHRGTFIKESFIEKDNTANITNLRVEDVVLDKDSTIFIASHFSHSIELADNIYTTSTFTYTDHTGLELISNNSDQLLIAYSYDEIIKQIEHINGTSYEDEPLSIQIIGDKIRYIADVQGDITEYGDITLPNTNNVDFTLFHGHPSGVYKYSNLIIAEANINSNLITGDTDISIYQQKNFSVYPNPSNGKVNIHSKSVNDLLELYNLKGEKVRSIKTTGSFMTLELPKGTYIMKYLSEDKTETQKLFVQ